MPGVPRWPSWDQLLVILESGWGRAAGRCGAPRFPAQAPPDSRARNLLPTSSFVRGGGAELVPVSEASWWVHSSGRCSAAEQEFPEKAPGANLQRRALRWAPDGCAAPPVRGAEIPRPQILYFQQGPRRLRRGRLPPQPRVTRERLWICWQHPLGHNNPRHRGHGGTAVVGGSGCQLHEGCWGRGAGGCPGAASPRWPRAQSGHMSPKWPQEPKVATRARCGHASPMWPRARSGHMSPRWPLEPKVATRAHPSECPALAVAAAVRFPSPPCPVPGKASVPAARAAPRGPGGGSRRPRHDVIAGPAP